LQYFLLKINSVFEKKIPDSTYKYCLCQELQKITSVNVLVFLRYLASNHKTPWDFDGIFTPISCPMKNPKNPMIFFSPMGL
jgi:hypothetical protein